MHSSIKCNGPNSGRVGLGVGRCLTLRLRVETPGCQQRYPGWDTGWCCVTKGSAEASLYGRARSKPRGRRQAWTQWECRRHSRGEKNKMEHGGKLEGRRTGVMISRIWGIITGEPVPKSEERMRWNAFYIARHPCLLCWLHPAHPETGSNVFLFRDVTSIEVRGHVWSNNLYSLQHRPGRRTRNKHLSFTIHSTMEKSLHDVCVCATPSTNSQVGLRVLPLDESTPEQQVSPTQRFADGKHTSNCDYRGRGDDAVRGNTTHVCVCTGSQVIGTAQRVRWTKDQLVVKYEQPACGLSVKDRQEWRRNVYSPQQTRAWIMHKSSKVLRTTAEPLFWNVNSASTSFLCSTSSLCDAHAGVCDICTRRDKRYKYKAK